MGGILFPDETIAESRYFRAAQDWEVPIPGFIIVGAKRPVRTIADLCDGEAAELGLFARDIRRELSATLGVGDAYLFQNEDTRHGFHVWMFPRYAWMEEFGRKIESLRPIMDYVQAASCIAPVIGYAQEHLVREQNLAEVRLAAARLRERLQGRYPVQKSS